MGPTTGPRIRTGQARNPDFWAPDFMNVSRKGRAPTGATGPGSPECRHGVGFVSGDQVAGVGRPALGSFRRRDRRPRRPIGSAWVRFSRPRRAGGGLAGRRWVRFVRAIGVGRPSAVGFVSSRASGPPGRGGAVGAAGQGRVVGFVSSGGCPPLGIGWVRFARSIGRSAWQSGRSAPDAAGYLQRPGRPVGFVSPTSSGPSGGDGLGLGSFFPARRDVPVGRCWVRFSRRAVRIGRPRAGQPEVLPAPGRVGEDASGGRLRPRRWP